MRGLTRCFQGYRKKVLVYSSPPPGFGKRGIPPHVKCVTSWEYLGLQTDVDFIKSSTRWPQQPPPSLKFVKEGHKVLMHFKEWHLKSTTYQVVDVTSLAAAYQNELEPIQKIVEKGRKVFLSIKRGLKKWQTRWWGNDRGPDKIVEGPYSKGEITAIAFSKKGKVLCIGLISLVKQYKFKIGIT